VHIAPLDRKIPVPLLLIIDTDTAADDCFALLVGLLDPRADLLAITMVAGNVGFDQQVDNAFLTVGLTGRLGDVPVHLGAREPLERAWLSASDVHGDGVGGLKRPDDGHAPSDEHAVDALVRLAREHRGELRIVAIGPLTNIALAVRKDPEFASNVGSLYVMGGSINARGNITPAAEYNVFVDPEAADIVFSAGFDDVVVISWDPLTITDAVFDQSRIDRIAALDTPLSRFFVRANQATFDFDLGVGIGGSSHCDSLTVLLALDRGLATAERRYRVEVETEGTLTRGATVFDWQSEENNVTAIEKVDGERFFEYMLGMLATTPVGA
jgi:purine nucleosidase